MTTEQAFVDTNVLVYAHFHDADQYGDSIALLDRAQSGDIELFATPQIFTEFYSVVTNPRRVSEPLEPDDALDAINDLTAMPGLTVLGFPSDILTRWTSLVRQTGVTGPDAFDVQIVAAMQANSLQRLYTYNTSDFSGFAGLDVATP